MQYRSEIDGLRAIAVIPVILFHAGFGLFSGGFVGVDVFFVISGYLITSIILEDLARERFSILRFYERRARRILPALFFVLLSVLPFAWIWMLPSQFQAFMKAVVSVCLFVSNVFFWNEADYFDQASQLKPLLHTWSLAVEEQYYVFFPLLLAGLWRFGRLAVFGVVLAIGAASFIYAEQYATRMTPDAAFFLLPARAWELLGGSVCAFVMHRQTPKKNEIGSSVGLGLIVYAIFAFDERLRWPSVYALVPVLGTMLIILFAHPGTMVARFLSVRMIVGLGLISYSAYLWHQPLFALARLRSLYPPDAVTMLGLSVVSLILAGISWKYVEAPFRHKSNPVLPTRAGVFAASLAMLVGVSLFATTFALRPDWRFGVQVVVNDLLVDPQAEQRKSWAPLDSGSFDGFPENSPVRRVLILGDSHSKDIFNALHFNAARWPDTVFRRAELKRDCVYFPDVQTIEDCISGDKNAVHALFEQSTDIILSARWNKKRKFPEFLPSLVRVLQSNGKTVALTSNTVEFDPDAPVLLRRLAALGQIDAQDAAQNFFQHRDKEIASVNARLRLIAADLEIPFLEKADYMCMPSQQTCTAMTGNGEAVMFDYGHYTIEGATWFGARMAEIGWLEPALRQ